jgi:thiamine-phosphate pyrophosphorylase
MPPPYHGDNELFASMRRVYAILDGPLLRNRGLPLTGAASALLDGGLRLLQLRWKDNWTAGVWEEAKRIASLCTEAGATLVVDDRADVARLLAAGVHVGQDDLPPAEARAIAGPDAIVGFSTHNEAQFRAATAQPVDYIALGPLFATTSKANPDPVVGVAELRRLRALTNKTVVGIGGITRERAHEVWLAGADSVAIIGDLYPPDGSLTSIRARAAEWVTMEQA